MAIREQVFQSVETQLDGAINNSVTSITVDNGAVFPSDGDFRIIIGDEIMLVTARSGNVLTVERGKESSTAASHADNDKVNHIATAEGLTRWFRQSVPFFGLTRPYGVIQDTNNNVLTASSFTTFNLAGSGGIVDGPDGTIVGTFEEDDNSLQGFYKSAPSTPYTIYVAYTFPTHASGTDQLPGIIFRESSSGKLMLLTQWFDDPGNAELGLFDYTNEDTFSATDFTTGSAEYHPIWMAMEDDGVDIHHYFSHDGRNFQNVNTEARGSFFDTAPDQVGFAIEQESGLDQQVVILHWSEE